MSALETLVRAAREAGASDLHLEPGFAPTHRVRGQLRPAGPPVAAAALADMARTLLGEGWADFAERRSADLAVSLAGTRCRVNVLHTVRGVGMAIRLLSGAIPTLASLNLHPAVRSLLDAPHGLVVVTGPTGSGKTSTLAALIQELNGTVPRHIITLEHPVEYVFRPAQGFIRQREVGRDTPTVSQGLQDALREDPDVLVVGEMRDPETMRLTLEAAETGHLVLATMHSATATEAFQRLVGSFAPERQAAVCAQLADVLVGVVAQRMTWRPEEKIRVPECEIVAGTGAVKANIRAGQFFKIQHAVDAGAADGMWSFARYREWLDRKKDWSIPASDGAVPDDVVPATPPVVPPRSPPARTPDVLPGLVPVTPRVKTRDAPRTPAKVVPDDTAPVLVLEDAEPVDLNALVKDLERRR